MEQVQEKAKFTAGPWEVAPTLNDDRIGIYDGDGYRIASVHDFNGRPENKANAALICAAPHLLEAAEFAVECLADSGESIVVDKLRAAISRALNR